MEGDEKGEVVIQNMRGKGRGRVKVSVVREWREVDQRQNAGGSHSGGLWMYAGCIALRMEASTALTGRVNSPAENKLMSLRDGSGKRLCKVTAYSPILDEERECKYWGSERHGNAGSQASRRDVER